MQNIIVYDTIEKVYAKNWTKKGSVSVESHYD